MEAVLTVLVGALAIQLIRQTNHFQKQWQRLTCTGLGVGTAVLNILAALQGSLLSEIEVGLFSVVAGLSVSALHRLITDDRGASHGTSTE